MLSLEESEEGGGWGDRAQEGYRKKEGEFKSEDVCVCLCVLKFVCLCVCV